MKDTKVTEPVLAELLARLELESAAEFRFFENMADLLESEEALEPAAIRLLFDAVEKETLTELLHDYLEDALGAVPENGSSAVELYTLLDSARMAMMGLCRSGEEQDLALLAEEFCRFHHWYTAEPSVAVWESGRTGRQIPLLEALTLARLEALGGESYDYDFQQALDFELDEYTMSFADLVRRQQKEEELYGQEAVSAEDLVDQEDLADLAYTDYVFTPDDTGKIH